MLGIICDCAANPIVPVIPLIPVSTPCFNKDFLATASKVSSEISFKISLPKYFLKPALAPSLKPFETIFPISAVATVSSKKFRDCLTLSPV